jgi:hypothetical protein
MGPHLSRTPSRRSVGHPEGRDQAGLEGLDRKTDAVTRARQQARREQAELVIKDQQGRIQSKDSHGHDPRRSKG